MADEAGWTYREHPSRIPGGFVWTRTVAHGPTRILPDGCIDLIWNEAVVFVAGPDTRAQAYSGKPGTPIRGVRLPPGLGPRVVGVPAYELADRRVPLEDLWDPAEVRRVTELIGAGERAGQVLEDLAHRRAARGAGSGSAGVTRGRGRTQRVRRPGPSGQGREGPCGRATGRASQVRAANRSTVLPSGSCTTAYR